MAPRKRTQAPETISSVVPQGDQLRSLIALRDRLAAETDDTTWQRHKAECHCVCGMGDGRLLAALVKELRAVMAEIASMPEAEGRSKLDDIESAVADLDQHRRSRRSRAAGS